MWAPGTKEARGAFTHTLSYTLPSGRAVVHPQLQSTVSQTLPNGMVVNRKSSTVTTPQPSKSSPRPYTPHPTPYRYRMWAPGTKEARGAERRDCFREEDPEASGTIGHQALGVVRHPPASV